MMHIGYCRYCKKMIHKKRKRDFLGRLVPCWAIVEGHGRFHDSCWEEYKKALKSKRRISFETPTTPLGKVKVEQESIE